MSRPSDILLPILSHPRTDGNGVVGLVDDLLTACWRFNLHLDCQAGRWRVRSAASQWEDLGTVPLRTSVVRAVLARIAAMCNELAPDSVTPYGGRGALALSTDPRA